MPDSMTPSVSETSSAEISERLAKIAARLKAATPWTPADCEYRVEKDGYITVPECSTLGDTLIMLSHDYENDGHDWDFLAHSQQDTTFLLSENARLSSALREAQARLKLVDRVCHSHHSASLVTWDGECPVCAEAGGIEFYGENARIYRASLPSSEPEL